MRQHQFNPIHKELNGLAQLMGNVLGKDMYELSKPLRGTYPAVNVKEDENGYWLDLVVPGIDKEAINIRLDRDLLVISYEKTEQTDKEQFLRKEYGIPSFKRSFTLPKIADTQNINASYLNGILTLNIAKKEVEVPKKINIL